jgi:hypothetical protein
MLEENANHYPENSQGESIDLIFIENNYYVGF